MWGRRAVKDDCKHFDLNQWKMDFASTKVKKTLEVADGVGKSVIWFWIY